MLHDVGLPRVTKAPRRATFTYKTRNNTARPHNNPTHTRARARVCVGLLWGRAVLLRVLYVNVARRGALVTRGRPTSWSISLGAAAMH